MVEPILWKVCKLLIQTEVMGLYILITLLWQCIRWTLMLYRMQTHLGGEYQIKLRAYLEMWHVT